MKERPFVTVAAVIEVENRYLVVEEMIGGKLVINQPAGHVESGETICAAIRREVLEETCYEFTPEFVTGIYQLESPNERKSFIRICFAGKIDGHDPSRTLDPDIVRPCWLSKKSLISCTNMRSSLVMKCVEDYERGHSYSLDILNDQIYRNT